MVTATSRTTQLGRRPAAAWAALALALTIVTVSAPLASASSDPRPWTRSASLSAAEPPMEFRTAHFPLRRLTPAELPHNDYSTPPMPPRGPGWDPRDEDGIKMRWVDGRLYYHPVELGLKSLRLLGGYLRRRESSYLAWAQRYLGKVKEIAVDSGGAWFIPYQFAYANERLEPPWYSGMAQGVILSAIMRVYHWTKEPGYLRFAERIVASFRRSGPSDRPWVSRVSSGGYLWIEEYPRNDRDDRVLNGFIFAVYGLHEYWQATGRGRRLLEGALHTLKTWLHLYRVPGGISYYCLYHKTRHAEYHLVHVEQLRFLAAMSGDDFFSRTADLWESDYDG